MAQKNRAKTYGQTQLLMAWAWLTILLHICRLSVFWSIRRFSMIPVAICNWFNFHYRTSIDAVVSKLRD